MLTKKNLPLKVMVLTLLASLSTISHAETLARQVMATGGGYMVAGDKTHGYTIGQPMISLTASPQLISGFWGLITPKPLLVNLGTFTTKVFNGVVFVKWKTMSELDNAAFVLWRAEPLQDATCSNTRSENYTNIMKLVFLPTKKGGLTAGDSYSYKDTTVKVGKRYCYGLEDIDFAGKRTFHNTIVSATVK